jgi:pimeloyl-ACP methyl ester carboxylesterase
MKLAIFDPSRIQAAFLLNPGCLQPFSLSPKNLYYNILPIVSPSEKNVSRFLDKAVFFKPEHQLSAQAEKLLIEYEVYALKEYKDNTQKPYDMGDELKSVNVDTYLYVGDKDLLFPYETSIRNAHERIKTLRDVVIYENVGHGIETYGKAIQAVGNQMAKLTRAVFSTVL